MLIILLISLSVFSLIAIYNLFTAPVLNSNNNSSESRGLVSVLIPARNEEKNIVKCINGIINQDYQHTEIIILDDNSSDNTYKLAASFSSPKIRTLEGKELPQNWLGKNWACHQLSQHAKGDYFLFVDADVEVKENVISLTINEIGKSNSALLSIFPTQSIKTFGEYLIVPLMNWLLLTLLPLNSIYKFSNKDFVAANGQFMLWRKDDYLKIGGHQIVKDKIVEDMELARIAKSNNLKVKTLLGGNQVFCRMYNSFDEAYSGFQKNFYSGFSIGIIFFLIIISFLFIVFTIPFFVMDDSLISWLPLLLLILTRISVSIRSKQSWFINLLLHPLQMIFMLWIGFISVIKFKNKSLVWKARNI
ncbi:MAG: glycosyltransferase [Ignavibacteriota bacterium]